MRWPPFRISMVVGGSAVGGMVMMMVRCRRFVRNGLCEGGASAVSSVSAMRLLVHTAEAPAVYPCWSGGYTAEKRPRLPCYAPPPLVPDPATTSSEPVLMLGKGPLLERVIAAVGNPAAHGEEGGARA